MYPIGSSLLQASPSDPIHPTPSFTRAPLRFDSMGGRRKGSTRRAGTAKASRACMHMGASVPEGAGRRHQPALMVPAVPNQGIGHHALKFGRSKDFSCACEHGERRAEESGAKDLSSADLSRTPGDCPVIPSDANTGQRPLCSKDWASKDFTCAYPHGNQPSEGREAEASSSTDCPRTPNLANMKHCRCDFGGGGSTGLDCNCVYGEHDVRSGVRHARPQARNAAAGERCVMTLSLIDLLRPQQSHEARCAPPAETIPIPRLLFDNTLRNRAAALSGPTRATHAFVTVHPPVVTSTRCVPVSPFAAVPWLPLRPTEAAISFRAL